MKIYYAKSDTKTGEKRVTNKEHLSKVADLAYEFGLEIKRPEEAKVAGLFHDTGKYGERFQGVLSGVNKGVDHAFSSAALLYLKKDLMQKVHSSSVRKKYEPIIESIQGHHDRLISMEELEEEFCEVIKDPQMDACPSKQIPSLRGPEEFREAINAFKNDFPTYHFPKLPERKFENQVENMLDTRMLFSCLVDADYSVSASDKEPDYLEKNSGSQLNAEEALKVLYKHCEELRKSSKADSKINKIRNQVFDICGDAGEKQPGLFTLTAPTGVGKTLAMLHFALRHCQENKMRRIIIVLPFLSLAEQSEKEYCKIVPNILVDHSQKNLPKEIRELASRWDAPMIITTSVKFFESLFADKPGDCRKLHSIANSVVVFDEAQSLPTELAPATVKAVNALCKRYNCSMVFSTATPVDIAKAAIEHAKNNGQNVVILDTAGRLQIDESMMQELVDVKEAAGVTQTLLVVDAMTGQEAVNVATTFNDRIGVDGVILTKLDGDTRGGAALSIRQVTGKPILYIGMGEKLSDLEQFYPDRMASRILGMGDVMSLIEKVEAQVDAEKAKEMEQKLRKASFDLNDYLDQMEQMKNMGGLSKIMEMLPGMGMNLNAKNMPDMDESEKQMEKIQAIIRSMTMKERTNPDIINASRKNRIAKGAGVDVVEVNRLLKQFDQSRKLMKQMPGMMGKQAKKGRFKLPF